MNLGNGLLAGTPLAEVDALSYNTYRSSASTGSPVQVPSLQIAVTGSSAGAATRDQDSGMAYFFRGRGATAFSERSGRVAVSGAGGIGSTGSA